MNIFFSDASYILVVVFKDILLYDEANVDKHLN